MIAKLLAVLCFILCSCLAQARDLELDFKGNSAFLDARLDSEIEFWKEDLKKEGLEEEARDDAAYALIGFYRQAGYPDSEIRHRARVTDGDRLKVTFEIHEGPFYSVDEVKIAHIDTHDLPESISVGDLSRAIPFPLASPLPNSPRVYSEKALNSGLGSIRLLFRLHGYLEAEIEAEVKKSAAANTSEIPHTILLNIQAGPLSKVTEISHSQLPEVTNFSWQEVIPFKVGQAYSPRLAIETKLRIKSYLQQRGYFDPVISVLMELTAPQSYKCQIEVDSGPIAKWNQLFLRGNLSSSSSWLHSQLEFKRNALFNLEQLDVSRRKLLLSGLFRSIKVSYQCIGYDSDNSALIDIYVDMEEKENIRLSAQAGFGSYEGARVGSEVLHKNLFGHGLEGSLVLKASTKGEQATGRLSYPFLFDGLVALKSQVRYERFEEVSFTSQELSLKHSLQFRPKKSWRLEGGHELREIQIHHPRPSFVSTEFTRDSLASLLFVEWQRDTRDSIINVQSGSFLSARLEHSSTGLGSELDFWGLRTRAAKTYTIAEGWQLAIGAQAGFILRQQSELLPLSERYFHGGSRSVRAFDRDLLGRKDSRDHPLGGEAYLSASSEIRFPLFYGFRAAAFFDVGTLNFKYQDFARKGYRYGPGVGLMYLSPIGILRVDAAMVLNRKSGEDFGAIHFIIGNPF